MIYVMLPIQYLRPAGTLADPYKRLMAAVLQTVIDDDCRGSDDRRLPGHRRAEARGASRVDAYLASPDRVWPFSFENLARRSASIPSRSGRSYKWTAPNDWTTPAAQYV
jgi:hypothetical protein